MNGAAPFAHAPACAERVLVLAPSGRDAKLTASLLEGEGIESIACATVEALCREMRAGAAVALLAEEALTSTSVASLKETLSEQQPWSDFPIVVFSAPGRSSARDAHDALRTLGNVTFLDRPVQVRTMLAAVHAGVRARRHQYEAQRAIESRDRFLAMLGHELRNPLGAIRLAIELLTNTAHPELRKEGTEVIQRQSAHLGHLVDDLLDVGRMTYGKVVLQHKLVDLAALLRGCVRTHLAVGHVTLTLDAADAVCVLGDPLRLEQVFGNLITNALKYTPSGGSVRVQVSAEEGRAVVRVVDSGIGIAPEMLTHVFELFAQADRSLDRAQGGMGLGLTVAKSLVELHDGDIRAESAGLGHGSEFRVSLPLHVSTDETAEKAAPTSSTVAPRKRVVVVEDNEDNREMLEALLALKGHSVSTAGSGPEGFERIVREAPDVALIDIGLPGFDGYELARRLRMGMRAPIFLVAMTGYGQPEDRRRATDAGFDAHLTKPVGLEQVESAFALSDPPGRCGGV